MGALSLVILTLIRLIEAASRMLILSQKELSPELINRRPKQQSGADESNKSSISKKRKLASYTTPTTQPNIKLTLALPVKTTTGLFK